MSGRFEGDEEKRELNDIADATSGVLDNVIDDGDITGGVDDNSIEDGDNEIGTVEDNRAASIQQIRFCYYKIY